jgi:hypothetical protein
MDFEISPGKLDSMDPFVVSGLWCSVEKAALKKVCIPAPKTRTSAWMAGVFSCIVAVRALRSGKLMCCRTNLTAFVVRRIVRGT